MDPIDLEFLKHPDDDTYFNKHDVDDKYKYYREKGRLIRAMSFNYTYTHLPKSDYTNALDTGAGRNSDYYLYLEKNFNTIIAYEPDVVSNIIYYSRMINQLKTKSKNKIPLTYIVSHKMESDISTKLSVFKVSMFSCTYTLHYFCYNEQALQHYKNTIL